MTAKITPYLRWDDGAGKPHIITFDTVYEETPHYNAILTKYPIERGADITDHSQVENVKLEVVFQFVDFPMLSSAAPASPIELYQDGFEGRAIKLFNQVNTLLRLDNIKPNTVDTTLVSYRSARIHLLDCLISNLTYTQDKESGNGIKGRMTLEQQTFAESKRIKTKRPAGASGQTCKTAGDKTPSTPDAKTQTVTSSYLSQGVNFVFGRSP